MEKYLIVPNGTEFETVEANSSEDAMITFAGKMDLDMSAYFNAIKCVESGNNYQPVGDIWRDGIVLNDNGRNVVITPAMLKEIFRQIKVVDGRNMVAYHTEAGKIYADDICEAVYDEYLEILMADSGEDELTACKNAIGDLECRYTVADMTEKFYDPYAIWDNEEQEWYKDEDETVPSFTTVQAAMEYIAKMSNEEEFSMMTFGDFRLTEQYLQADEICFVDTNGEEMDIVDSYEETLQNIFVISAKSSGGRLEIMLN